MSAIFEDPALAKIFAMVLLAIIGVLVIAVIILAVKKNQIIYVEKEEPASGSEPAVPQPQPEAHTFGIQADCGPQNTETVSVIDLPKRNPIKVDDEDGITVGIGLDVYVGNRNVHTTIKDFPCMIGREAETCDIVISEPAVSRKHARILLENGEVFLEDVSDHNGTYLNDMKLPPLGKAVVHLGDTISLGRARMIVTNLVKE